MPLFSSEVPTHHVDVVVIGGGIQGLWLLGDLVESGYQAVLLERKRPGFGQTGHAHVFLHEGHIYASMLQEKPEDISQRVAAVSKANKLWKEAIESGRLQHVEQLRSNFYIGWNEPSDADRFEERCTLTNLPYQEVDAAKEFGQLTNLSGLYKSEGICLESSTLLEHLLNFRNVNEMVCCCEEIQVGANDLGSFDFLARHSDDFAGDRGKVASIQIRADAVILSAGAGNEILTNRVFDNTATNHRATRQQTVKTFMLVLRDLRGSLPRVAGMFPQAGGIFLVSRKDPEDRTVWLIGDKQRQLVAVPGEMTTFDAVSWFSRLRDHMQKLLPDIITNAVNYEWGIYEATKAERLTTNRKFALGGAFPESYHVHRNSTGRAWLVWPTLLTFAPLVSSSIVADLKNSLNPGSTYPNWTLWNGFRANLPANDCRWKKTPLQSWQEFKGCFAR